MRILYVLTSLGMGGAENQTLALAERMAVKEHVVALLVLKHAQEEWPVKVPVMRLNMESSLMGLTRGLRFAYKFVAMFQPELVHSHTYPANLFARALVFLSRRKDEARLDRARRGRARRSETRRDEAGLYERRVTASRPVLVNTIHNVFEGGWLRMLGYRFSASLVDEVTAVSEAAAERYRQLTGTVPDKVRVLTNGIDLLNFAADRVRRHRMRQAMEAEDKFIWLAAGRIAPAKDYPNLLRAFDQLSALPPHAQLWIAGEGDTAKLEKDSPSGVRFLGLRRDIRDLLDLADGFVLSSAWEGMPLVLAEAMAMGKVVVATKVGGVTELVGDAGILVDAANSDALAEAMCGVMNLNDRDRVAMGRRARRRIEELFSIEVKAAEWETLYLKLYLEATADTT